MNTALVITVIGPDRPGLVERLATLVSAHGGNWLESRMSRLGGEFAGILRIAIPADREPLLIAGLSELQAVGLTSVARRDEAPATANTPGPLVTLDLVGQDRPGIVRHIAAALAARGANVEELITECVSAPMSGEPLFKAKARLALRSESDLPQLRAELEAIAADLLVDLTLVPVTAPP